MGCHVDRVMHSVHHFTIQLERTIFWVTHYITPYRIPYRSISPITPEYSALVFCHIYAPYKICNNESCTICRHASHIWGATHGPTYGCSASSSPWWLPLRISWHASTRCSSPWNAPLTCWHDAATYGNAASTRRHDAPPYGNAPTIWSWRDATSRNAPSFWTSTMG